MPKFLTAFGVIFLIILIALAVPIAVYCLLGLFGIHFAFWKVMIATYLVTFILNAIFPRNNN